MDDGHLREFIALADCRNFTKAAAKVHMSQPALSKHIAALEGELGFKLVSRESEPVSLTPLGRVFLEHARQIVVDYDEAFEHMKKLRSTRPMEILVETYIPYRPMEDLIRTVKRDLKLKYPLLNIIVRGIEDTSPLDDVRNGTADMCFISFSNSSDMSYLETTPLYPEPLVAVVRREHRLAERKAIAASEVDSEIVWMPSSPALADHCALLKDMLLAHGANPQFITKAWNRTEQLFEFDFTAGMHVGAAGGILQEATMSSFNDYSVLRFEDEDMVVTCHAIFREDTQNEACAIFLNSLKSAIAHVDLSLYWSTASPGLP